jgi:hypothetical protein
MTSTRETSVIVGLLFLTQTVAFIIAEQPINGVVKGRPDFVTEAAAHVNALVTGGLLAALSDVTKGAGLVASVPGGVFELALPIWLLAKGFNATREAAISSADRQFVSAG